MKVPDRASDSNRVPTISPALSRALQEVKGMNAEERLHHVATWNARFKGADRPSNGSSKGNINSTNALGD